MHEKFIRDNNEGMSIVTVIVAIGFVAVLVSIVMISAVINFKMKAVNVHTKESFYSAEQVLDEINVGLQKMVSDGLSYSYTSVMENYAMDGMSAAEKNEKVKAEFYQYIWDQIGTGTKNEEYVVMSMADDSLGLYGLLKDSTKWNNDASSINYKTGAFLRGGKEAGDLFTGTMVSTKDNGIVLKDLTVYYKDNNGFVSAIKTDIRLVYPNFAFSNTDTPDILDYSFITDTALEQNHTGVTKAGAFDVSVEGNSFAYAVDAVGTKLDFKKVENNGDLHIVATDINLNNGGITTNDDSVLWARDITAKSSDVKLAGYSYIADDLDIKGRDSQITFTGYYNGYGNSLNGSEGSSAILVNGTETIIDFSNVKKLTLAGRAYVATTGETAEKKVQREFASDDEKKAASDIYTGESIAVKSDQLMYLVPPECIGVAIKEEEDGSTSDGLSMYNKNPLTLTEYNAMQMAIKDGKCREIGLNKKISKLGNTMTLADFIEDESSVEKAHIRSSRADGTKLVYYYMKFKDEEAANLYFARYYNLNQDAVDRYMSKYIKAVTFPEGTNGMVNYMRFDMAGNAVTGKAPTDAETNGYEVVTSKMVPAGDTPSGTFVDDNISYSDQFTAYCTMLSPDLVSLEKDANILLRSDNNFAVFKNLINEEMLKDIGDVTISDDASGLKVRLITGIDPETEAYKSSHEPVHISNDYDLVIANCDVQLTGSKFEGLIIAKGKITVPNSNFEFKANPKKVEKCMLLKTEDEVYTVTDLFSDADEMAVKSIVDEKYDDASLSSLVMYENWTKNVNIK